MVQALQGSFTVSYAFFCRDGNIWDNTNVYMIGGALWRRINLLPNLKTE